jgi:hypothetical protein
VSSQSEPRHDVTMTSLRPYEEAARERRPSTSRWNVASAAPASHHPRYTRPWHVSLANRAKVVLTSARGIRKSSRGSRVSAHSELGWANVVDRPKSTPRRAHDGGSTPSSRATSERTVLQQEYSSYSLRPMRTRAGATTIDRGCSPN